MFAPPHGVRVSTARPRVPRVVIPEVAPRRGREKFPAPRGFRPVRSTAPGRLPLLEVFAGLEDTVPFHKYPGDDAATLRIAQQTWAHVSEGPGWMYVAPRKTPPEVRAAGFRMVESRDDEIVVARSHLTNSPSMDLYLDIIHEFLHILQRRQGRILWLGRKVAYVDRPTEVEAYAFSVCEARRLGVPDSYLRKYLEVTWVGKADYLRLLRHVGVSSE
ncbi:MAG: hypothetical protein L3K17_03360 [Thermoplasmata archaeon]|nr:hypothetical protein [Thermoplasmata archaeon]